MTGTPMQAGSNSFNWQMAELLNSINIGFFSRDLLTESYLNLSDGLPRIYGYSLPDFYSNSRLWYEVILEEDRQVTEKEIDQLRRGEKSIAEYRIRHKDGSIRWLEVRTLPVFQNSVLIRVEGIVYDVTERKEAELATIKAKELSESLINSLPGVFYVFDDSGRYIKWNKNFELITGRTAEEMAVVTPFELIPPEDHAALAAAIEDVMREGRGQVEARLLSKNGDMVMYYFSGQRLIIDGKNCIAGMGIDITIRKTAELALQKHQQMLTQIIDLIPQSIFWKDNESRYMGGNAVFAKMMGVSNVESIIGKSDFELCKNPEEAVKYRRDDLQIIQSGQPQLHYIETLTQTNEEVSWLDTSKIPLKDETDEVYGILAVIDDITEKKNKEDNLRRMNEELIQRNIKLTDFSYIVSHELRAPICKILGLSEILDKENPLSDTNQEIIELLKSEVSNLDLVVRDMNTILDQQNTAGKPSEIVNIRDIFQETQTLLMDEVSRLNATLSFEGDTDCSLPSIRSYLFSIFKNLVSNALKYSRPGVPPSIQIECLVDADELRISFKDNGLGLDLARYGHKVFDIYKNFHPEITAGRGIGLRLVKTQAEALGGKIEVESSPGEGSIFRVVLPVR